MSNPTHGQDKNVIAVDLSDVPSVSRESDSDYLTAICTKENSEGECIKYKHKRDTPTSDRPEV